MKFGPYLKTHIHINFYKLGKPSGYCPPALRGLQTYILRKLLVKLGSSSPLEGLTNLHFIKILAKHSVP